MHILESYATSCGLKIDKPLIMEQFFPLPFEKYITIHGFAKFSSRCYDYWEEVLSLISPVLEANGIKILQVGGKDEPKLRKCICLNGQTSINQLTYVVRKSLLHVGVDSFPIHLASGHVKILGLYPNMYPSNSKPYWSNDSDVRLVEPDRGGKKPSFAANESPKEINNIKPECIAEHIFDLLGIPFNFPLNYEYFGELYNETTLELVPNSLISSYSVNVDGIRIRMDYLFNEEVLVENLKLKNASIVTNREINPSIISAFKDKIKQITYIIEEDNNPEFIRDAMEKGISCILTSYLPNDRINAHKINYMEYGIIVPQSIAKREDFNFSSKPSLLYKSRKFILSAGNVYPSKAALENNSPSNSFEPTLNTVIDSPSFWKEAKYFAFLSHK